MLIITILTGIIALMAAYHAGITSTWLGTGSVTGIVLLLAIAALPQCYWLFDSGLGALLTVAIWAVYTTFLHRMLTDKRRCAPMNADARRHVFVWKMGRQQVILAWAVAK